MHSVSGSNENSYAGLTGSRVWYENKSRRTTVRWELTSNASGTQVKVTHSGLANEEAAKGL